MIDKKAKFAENLSNEFDCKQGAVRAVRFNGKHDVEHLLLILS